ncbi:hypothetical protein [Cyclobacterium xiamenense]|jgi:hypothetical protein|uniref:hypothetical protein n=1 Tax=Cyclobacterium xiamenense TaxID=1297121 RepID=UPI0035CFB341
MDGIEIEMKAKQMDNGTQKCFFEKTNITSERWNETDKGKRKIASDASKEITASGKNGYGIQPLFRQQMGNFSDSVIIRTLPFRFTY